MGYSLLIPSPPCNVGPLTTYYISSSCLATSCDLSGAFAIYTDEYCTILADDGTYSDGINYGSQNSGVFTFNGPC